MRYYLAFWNGSGATERELGADAAIQQEHVGTKIAEQSEEDAYANSGVLELQKEGPQVEEDLFLRGDAGVLLLTSCSRFLRNGVVVDPWPPFLQSRQTARG